MWAACEGGEWAHALTLLSDTGAPGELGLLMSTERTQGEALGSLHLAASRGRHEVVAALLRRGCDISLRTSPSSRTSLHLAMDALNGVAAAALRPVEGEDDGGRAAAERRSFVTTVKLLLVNGGSGLPGAKDVYHKTCWEYCTPDTVRRGGGRTDRTRPSRLS